ncbi:MAG: OmpA family protein [Deltaproteobacteria bacterium]|nr:OmpA family protein [Deltaproteobacteria bacterium]
MKRLVSFLTAAALGCGLLSSCVSRSAYDRKEREAIRLTETLRLLETENQALLSQKGDLVSQTEALRESLQEAFSRNDDLRQGTLQAGDEIEYLRKQLLTVRTDNARLAQQLEKERIERENRLAELQKTYDTLVKTMEEELRSGEMTISELQGKLTVNLVEKILFDSGSAEVNPKGLQVLKRVGAVLKQVEGKEIRVEGHSDNLPISSRLKDAFPTNWELSAARALHVVRFLQEQAGVPGEALSACGFAHYQPVADNRTPEGRARNRRIQIVLVPKTGP